MIARFCLFRKKSHMFDGGGDCLFCGFRNGVFRFRALLVGHDELIRRERDFIEPFQIAADGLVAFLSDRCDDLRRGLFDLPRAGRAVVERFQLLCGIRIVP